MTDPVFKTIIVAGATGNLGSRICQYLLQNGAQVKALVRKTSNPAHLLVLQKMGVDIVEVEYTIVKTLHQACIGAHCVVSALSGLRDVIVDAQTALLKGAVAAGVPRFIPSDFCIDYLPLPPGSNRNLDLRREFKHHVDNASISATSILNGMHTHLLTGQAPVILNGLQRVVYWGNAGQLLDFTTIENTAHYTAKAALDAAAPRFLRIAGEASDSYGLAQSAATATGKPFKLLRAGGLGRLQSMIKITRTLFPKPKEVFPPWQGMQYLHDMYSGLPKLEPLDNQRYTGIHWTSVEEVLTAHERRKALNK